MQFCQVCTGSPLSPLSPSAGNELRVATELKAPGRAEGCLKTALLHLCRSLLPDHNLPVTAVRMSEAKHADASPDHSHHSFCTTSNTLDYWLLPCHSKNPSTGLTQLLSCRVTFPLSLALQQHGVISIVVGQCSEEAQRLLHAGAVRDESNGPVASASSSSNSSSSSRSGCSSSSSWTSSSSIRIPASGLRDYDMEEKASTSEAAFPGCLSQTPAAPVPMEWEQPQEEPGQEVVTVADASAQGSSFSPSTPVLCWHDCHGDPGTPLREGSPESPQPPGLSPALQEANLLALLAGLLQVFIEGRGNKLFFPSHSLGMLLSPCMAADAKGRAGNRDSCSLQRIMLSVCLRCSSLPSHWHFSSALYSLLPDVEQGNLQRVNFLGDKQGLGQT